MRWLANARRKSEPSVAEVEAAFEEIWQTRGPVRHAFCNDYRRLASQLVAGLVRAGAGRRFLNAKPLAINLPHGRVVVEPNELAELPDGTVAVRRVRTGRKRVKEYDRLEYALYRLAADEQLGPTAAVQALHLTDEAAETVTTTAKKLDNRRTRSDDLLGRILDGKFPPQPDAVACPRCPHFFICPSIPRGALTLP